MSWVDRVIRFNSGGELCLVAETIMIAIFFSYLLNCGICSRVGII